MRSAIATSALAFAGAAAAWSAFPAESAGAASCRPRLDQQALRATVPALRASVERWLPAVTRRPRQAALYPPQFLARPTPVELRFEIPVATVERRVFFYEVLMRRRGCGRWRVIVAAAAEGS